MSDHGAPAPRDTSPGPSNSRVSRSSLTYEFIDSQDPRTKSQIQRHTAHHVAQQRRDAARMRLLGESPTRWSLEWQRRSDVETTSPKASSSPAGSVPASPSREPPVITTSINHPSSPTNPFQDTGLSPLSSPLRLVTSYTEEEEDLLSYYESIRCPRRSHAVHFSRLLYNVREDPSAAYLIIAYAAAHRAESGFGIRIRDLALTAEYKTKALTLVNSRIQTAHGIHKASNQNIQAVLFLVAYESRFGNPLETATHLSGLRGMIQERGGIHACDNQPTLYHQLLWVELSGTAATILDCTRSCGSLPMPITAAVAYHTWAPISLTVPKPGNDDLCQSFMEKLRQFQSYEHVNILHGTLGRNSVMYQLTSAALEYDEFPWSNSALLLTECRLACLVYINALILTSTSVQNANDILYEAIVLRFGTDYPTSASPLGLLWAFLYSLQLRDTRNRGTLKIVLDMMQAARLLKPQRLQAVEDVLMQLMFDHHYTAEASLCINETEIMNDMMS